MESQERVQRFVETHDLSAPPAYRALDLVSEVGEVSKEIVTATNYGERPGATHIAEDEIGDALFALLALCNQLDIDAATALEASMTKYERRIESDGDPGSDTS